MVNTMNNSKNYKKKPILYIVAPCYNEEEGLDKCAHIILDKLYELEKSGDISKNSKILFVNDGSKDKTEEILNKLVNENDKFAMVSFLSNAGHQNAVYAGMMTAKDNADIVVTIDVDLQQDINKIIDFINKYKEGNDVVYGVRNDRSSDSFFKKTTASLYYGFMKKMGSTLFKNSADYRLLSKKAIECLSNYPEDNLFLRGLIPTMGLTSDVVYFDVKERELGESKYTFKKMFNLALSGITSFSVMPIHYIFLLGCLLDAISLILLIVLLVSGLNALNGLYVLVTMLVGFILISVGVVGEYVGTTNLQVKNRPRYIVNYTIIKKVNKRNEK